MKSILKSILDWLDKKYPDKVILTMQQYQEREKALDARLKLIESEIVKFNAHFGFGIPPMTGISQPLQR